jgi:hypothetical protein
MLALKECLLAELKSADGTSDDTASGEGYDETLHSLMRTFLDICLTWDKSRKLLHAQNAPALLQWKHHSANF